MKRMFRKIRHRICRDIYYADWCPIENRKNYKQIAVNVIACFGLCFTAISIFLALFLVC